MSSLFSQDPSRRMYPETDALPRCFLHRASSSLVHRGAEILPPASLPSQTERFEIRREEPLQDVLAPVRELPKEALREWMPLLVACLLRESEDVRMEAIDLLGTLDESDVPLDKMCQMLLIDPSWKVRAAAAQTLGTCHTSFPGETLLRALAQEQDGTVREVLMRAFGKNPEYIPLVECVQSLLHDPDWLVREAAAWTLGQLRRAMPLEPLMWAARHDEDESVRAAAAVSLGWSWNKEMVDVLYHILAKDRDGGVRDAAAWALQELDHETRGMRSAKRTDHTIPPPCFKEGEQLNTCVFPTLTPTMASDQEIAFDAVAQFIKNKQGCVNRSHLISTEDGCIVFLNCIYRRDGQAFHEKVLPSVRDETMIEPLDSALSGQDDIVRTIVVQAYKDRETRHWQDFFLVAVSLDISHDNTAAFVPCRVIVAAMGCHHVRENDVSVMNQIVDTLSDRLPDVFSGQSQPHLTHLKIWHQIETVQPVA